MRWLLLATLLLTGCLLPPTGYDAMGYDAQGAHEKRLPSSVVIQKAGQVPTAVHPDRQHAGLQRVPLLERSPR